MSCSPHQNLPSLEIATHVPNLYESVMVIGYPLGGDNISVTRGPALFDCVTSVAHAIIACVGVVSRITTLAYEDDKYDAGLQELIAVQIDAAINHGNSGGCVINLVI